MQGPSESQKAVLSAIEVLFNSEKHSDLTIKCGDSTWHAHKAVLCLRSSFFEKACCGEFKEAKDCCIKLDDDPPLAVEAMLRYLYTADYSDEPQTELEVCSPLILDVLVLKIADKYSIPALVNLAAAKYASRAKSEWSSDAFAESIREMYTSFPEAAKVLQDCAVELSCKHAEFLFDKGNEHDKGGRFREVADGTPKFAAQVAARLVNVKKDIEEELESVRQVAAAVPKDTRYKCIGCSFEFHMTELCKGTGPFHPDRVHRTCPFCSKRYDSLVWGMNRVRV